MSSLMRGVIADRIADIAITKQHGGRGVHVRPIHDHQADLRRGPAGDVLRTMNALRESQGRTDRY